MSGSAALTVTVSRTSPSSSVRSTVVVVPVSTIASRMTRLKPTASAETLYSPGGRADALYVPAVDVVTVRSCPVSRFVTPTSAAATAPPDESVTTPAMEPLGDCAATRPTGPNNKKVTVAPTLFMAPASDRRIEIRARPSACGTPDSFADAGDRVARRGAEHEDFVALVNDREVARYGLPIDRQQSTRAVGVYLVSTPKTDLRKYTVPADRLGRCEEAESVVGGHTYGGERTLGCRSGPEESIRATQTGICAAPIELVLSLRKRRRPWSSRNYHREEERGNRQRGDGRRLSVHFLLPQVTFGSSATRFQSFPRLYGK